MKKHRHRPLHKRLALHPLTILALLCFGVFMVGATFRAQADTLQVTATVHAQLPSAPAVITSYYDQQHVSTPDGTVSGTCPADSYVKLYRNDAFVGVADCSAGSFSMPIIFNVGANKLQARVYNITDDEGLQSSPVTVYYDQTTVTPQVPDSTPTGLVVTGVDEARYKSGRLAVVGYYPTFSGLAPPFSKLTITVHSEPKTCLTSANASGWWSCTFSEPLEPGIHSVEVVAVTPDGRTLRFPIFYIQVLAAQPSVRRELGGTSLQINAAYRYQARYQGDEWTWDMSVTGGTPPYKVTIDWGDGTMSNRDRDDSNYFTISHTYQKPGVYRPTIRVVDGNGKSDRAAVMQLLAIVKPTSGAPMSTKTNAAAGISNYLWILWPTYAVIFLMVMSFWLGELELARKFRPRRR